MPVENRSIHHFPKLLFLYDRRESVDLVVCQRNRLEQTLIHQEIKQTNETQTDRK